MKILLFGKDGQVGTELQRALAPLGELVAFGSPRSAAQACDFRDPAAVAAIVRALRPDVVVNAAAYTDVDRAESDRDTALLVNATTPGAIAREAQACGALLLHYSSDYVFDGSGSEPWVESDPVGPLNVYGASKLEGERAVQRGVARHLVLRTSWIYGAHGGNFAARMLQLAQQRERLAVVDDQVGAPTGADLLADVTATLVRQAMQDAALCGVYHAAASGEVSWHGYARFVLEQAIASGLVLRAGPDQVDAVPSASYPTPARRPHNSRLDMTKLRRVTGFEMPPWQDGVARHVAQVVRGGGGAVDPQSPRG